MEESAQEKIAASVGILTFNSAEVLGRALESVKMFDDIVLCDGGSTDGTLEIARAYGARVIPQSSEFKNPDGSLNHFGGVRQQLLEAAKHEWFLYIDSDETISDGLREEIRRIVKDDSERPHAQFLEVSKQPLVYRVPIGIVLNDRVIKYSSNFPGYQHRFFNKRSGAHFIKPVHERIEFNKNAVPIGTLKNPWYTYTTNDDWNRYLYHTVGYRHQQVLMYARRPWKDFWKDLVLGGARIFIGATLKSLRNYILHGFKDSIPVRGEIGRALAPVCLMLETAQYKLSHGS